MHRKIAGGRCGLPGALGILLVLCALVGPALQLDAAAAQKASVAASGPDVVTRSPLDLAAMALTPTDLAAAGFEGYRVLAGQAVGSYGLTAVIGGWTDQLTNDDVQQRLEEAGLLRGHEFGLRLRQAPDDAQSQLLRDVYASVHEFADGDGATEAFAFLGDLSAGSSTVQRVEGGDRIGDGAVLVRSGFEVGGQQTQELAIAFRADRIIALIRIWDYTNQEPVIADGEAMAGRLLKRIEAGLGGKVPGLGVRVLRLAGGQIGLDDYLRRDGVDFPFDLEPADELAHRVEIAGDASDMYAFVERLESDDPALPAAMGWGSRLYWFSDAAAATAWLDAQRARPDASPNVRGVEVRALTVMEGVPTFGDESFAVSYTMVFSDGFTSPVLQIRLPVGAVAADVSITADDPPLAVVEALAAGQVTCLGADGCPDPVPVADALGTSTEPGAAF
jgi:hypothetical protein